jgi:hypothetical protein
MKSDGYCQGWNSIPPESQIFLDIKSLFFSIKSVIFLNLWYSVCNQENVGYKPDLRTSYLDKFTTVTYNLKTVYHKWICSDVHKYLNNLFFFYRDVLQEFFIFCASTVSFYWVRFSQWRWRRALLSWEIWHHVVQSAIVLEECRWTSTGMCSVTSCFIL